MSRGAGVAAALLCRWPVAVEEVGADKGLAAELAVAVGVAPPAAEEGVWVALEDGDDVVAALPSVRGCITLDGVRAAAA
jgi:hypothetical protein